MYRVNATRSLGVFWEELVFLEVSLSAVPETVGLALPVTAHLAALEGVEARDQQSLRKLVEARMGRRVNRIQIDDWKDAANVVRMDVYGKLVVLAAKQGKGKKWVRSFFPALVSKKTAV